MLRLSTKGRYGIRAMMELGSHKPGEPVLMSTIADRQDISRKYLHALLTSLRTAGLVRSVRGASGGFTLSRPPAEITVLEVIEILEGPLVITECVLDCSFCQRAETCKARVLWTDLSQTIRHRLEAISLADILDEHSGWRERLAVGPVSSEVKEDQEEAGKSSAESKKAHPTASRRRMSRSAEA